MEGQPRMPPWWISNIFESNKRQKTYGKVLSTIDRRKWLQLCQLEQGSPEWMEQRGGNRITASKAHSILHGRTKETRWNYFFGEALKPFTVHPNCAYGIEMEPEARNCFMAQTGYDVHQVGLIVRADQSYLAGSPDGLYLDEAGNLVVLEIKCPISCRDTDTINVPYLDYSADGSVKLKPTHSYFTQIQILMYVIGATKCLLYVYSRQDQKSVIVSVDDQFLEQAVTALGDIYYNEYWPEIERFREFQMSCK